jgi:hypothetical protein
MKLHLNQTDSNVCSILLQATQVFCAHSAIIPGCDSKGTRDYEEGDTPNIRTDRDGDMSSEFKFDYRTTK